MKNNLFMFGIAVLLFGSVIPFWLNSPQYKAEKEKERDQVINLICENRLIMSLDQKTHWMHDYDIKPEEVEPGLILRKY